MAKVTLSKGKLAGINSCANARGVIAAAAMDQRGSLQKSISKARGGAPVSTAEMTQFKTAVTQVLTKHALSLIHISSPKNITMKPTRRWRTS